MLKLKNVSKYYHSNDVVAMGLRKIDLEFKLGEFIAVTGESGSGKSTLLNILSGLDTYEDGEMYVEGEETSYFSIEEWENYRRKYIGFVFQNYNIIDSYSVYENVMVALTIQGYDKATRKERALELIERVGLTSHKHHKASKLSGGQKQRAVIARALAKDCPIIVADEPTGNLDSESSKKIIELLKEISTDKLVIIVTHSYEEVEEYATRKIRLFDGEVVEDKKIKTPQVVENPVEVLPYKMKLLDLLLISAKNLYRVPKKTMFTLIVSIFIAFVFISTYGSFEEQNNYSDYTYNQYFQSVTPSRIIVVKSDKTAFSLAEISALNDISKVKEVINYDIVLDARHFVTYETEWGFDGLFEFYPMPSSVLNRFDLSKGRLPENSNEIVIEDVGEFDVGDQVEMIRGSYYKIDQYMSGETVDGVESFLVVGLIDSPSNNYIYKFYIGSSYFEDEEVIKYAVEQKSFFSIELDDFIESFTAQYIGIDNTLSDNEVKVNGYINMTLLAKLGLNDDPNGLAGTDFELSQLTSFEKNSITVTFNGVIDDTDFNQHTIFVNQATYDSLIVEDIYQVSLMVTDSYDSDSVLNAAEDLGYTTIYPSGVVDPFTEITRMLQRIGMGITLTFVLVVIYFISYIVLKNIQTSKKKDYVIFRSIGASKKDLNKVTLFELFLTFTIAYLFTVSLLLVNEQIDTSIPKYLRYFSLNSFIYIYILLLVLGLLLGNKFNKKIFSSSVITSLRGE